MFDGMLNFAREKYKQTFLHWSLKERYTEKPVLTEQACSYGRVWLNYFHRKLNHSLHYIFAGSNCDGIIQSKEVKMPTKFEEIGEYQTLLR